MEPGTGKLSDKHCGVNKTASEWMKKGEKTWSESEGEKPFSNVTLVASVNSGNIVLSWNAPGNGDYQYYIFRSENSTVAANSLNQIGASSAITTTSYSDTAAESGKTYYYKILVVDRSNNEQIASSNTVQVNN